MTYRVLDSNGDYSFGHGVSGFVTGIAAVRQAIQTKLNMLQGEWWEKTNDGFPLFQEVLGTSGTSQQLAAIDLMIKSRILEVPNVVGFSSFKSNFDHSTRHYSAAISVNTTYGILEVTLS